MFVFSGVYSGVYTHAREMWSCRYMACPNTTPGRHNTLARKQGRSAFLEFLSMQRLLNSRFGSHWKKSCRLLQDVFVADHHMVSYDGFERKIGIGVTYDGFERKIRIGVILDFGLL